MERVAAHGTRVLLAAAAIATLACATTRTTTHTVPPRVGVLTPVDGVPVRSGTAWLPATDTATARDATLVTLRGDLAVAFAGRGVAACEEETLRAGAEADVGALRDAAATACADGVDVVVSSELLAYGEVRRSWLWVLAAQALAAGVGHGVAAAAVSGSAATGWWIGLGELALETATWVGGALVASQVIDPVVIRFHAYDCSSQDEIGRWTGEGTRPLGHWLRTRDEPPRAERLRSVADRVFQHAARRITKKVVRLASAAGAAATTGGTDARTH